MNLADRRFPPARSVEELEACFVVLDASGQRLGFFYFGMKPGRRSAAKPLTRDRGARGLRRISPSLPEDIPTPAVWGNITI